MAEEEVKYTIPYDSGHAAAGSVVDVRFTYDPNSPNADGSFTVTGATGTYQTTDSSGNVVDTDTITGLAAPGAFSTAQTDNELFITANPAANPIFALGGITFTISNAADSNDTSGDVNIYDANGAFASSSAPTDTPAYSEDGSNTQPATSITEAPVCFVAGTRIRTTRGDVAVEALGIGDIAVTASGAHRPIRWLGHRAIDCRRHPRPHEVMPVRIRADAFGQHRPSRDLFVSPGHSICVDVCGEVLIPAASLINGSTIRQVEVDTVTYWHVELEGGHNIVLAENLACESYLEMGNRGFFGEAAVVDLAAGPDAAARRTHADFCRPFHDGGALVEVVRAQILARAEQLGWRLDRSSAFADLHLVVDGTRIEPATRGLSARFVVPAGARDVWLVSSSARPCDVGAGGDRRDLGIRLAGLTIEDGFACRTIALDDPLLGLGLHALEPDGRRWTAGQVHLPAALWDGCEHGFYLRVDLGGPALPRWIAETEMATPASPRSTLRTA